MVRLPPDDRARTTALNIGQSHHVEAPAGSGKTMLLAARFLKLLTVVRHPHEILALTFTNKAAGEMKIRIGGLMEKAVRGLKPTSRLEADLLKLAQEALEHHEARRFLLLSPEGLQVMTFHGFCYTLVKRTPLEAEVPPESAVLEEEEQNLFLDEAIREMINHVVSMPEDAPERIAFENRLLRLNNQLPALADEIKDLVRKRDLFSDLVEALRDYPNLNEFEKALVCRTGRMVEEFLREAARAFAGTPLGKRWEVFWRHLRDRGAPNAHLLPECLPEPLWRELSSWQTIADTLATKDGKPRRLTGPAHGGFHKGFSKGPFAGMVAGLSTETTRLLGKLRELPGPDDSLTDVDALADLIILVAKAMATYENKCRRQHVLDFVGLEQAALRTLTKDVPGDMQLFLDHRIQHILVDEFQDTSRSQWILLQRLCEGWSRGDGRTLFLVGDPKQSVYAFRKAEVRLFLKAREGIPIVGREPLRLTSIKLHANFRSKAPLVNWINRLFGLTVMADPKAALDEVPFQPSIAFPETEEDPQIPPVSLNIFSEDISVSQPAEAEALWLAQSVKSALEKGRDETVGVLLFTRKRLPLYLSALRKVGLAVRVKEGLRMAEQPEVMHLYEMTTALCRPHDDLAWASLVRTPWAWVDVSLLLEIANLPPVGWVQKFKLAAQNYPQIESLIKAIQSGRQRVGRDPLGKVVGDVWLAMDGPARVASAYGGEGVANCRMFLEILKSVESGIPEETLLRLDQAMETLYCPESPDATSVRADVMTVHGAKGLEFDTVFLPFLDWKPVSAGQAPPYLLERSSEPPGLPLIAMARDRRLAESDPGYRLLKRIADGRKVGEAKRLLYVGMTRARKALFLSALAKSTSSGFTPTRDTPLDWILTHIANHGDEFISTCVNPCSSAITPSQDTQMSDLPEPIRLSPQPVPYVIETPSGLPDTPFHTRDHTAADAQPGRHAGIRGVVTHRLIETLWCCGELPDSQKIASALSSEGMNPETADMVSEEIQAELQACRKEPFFQWLLDRSNPGGRSEYPLEAVKSHGVIQVGALDFVRQDGNRWWIVDFKTSRPEPGQAEAEFVKEQIEHYRPQLSAYRDMLAKAEQIDRLQIRMGLYFTGLQQWHEMG